MKRIFLVDVDDTILDFQGAASVALKEAFFHYQLPWKEEYIHRFHALNTRLWSALERKELTRETLHETRFFVYLQDLGFSDVDGREFNRFFLEHIATHPVCLEGAKEFLTALRERGEVYFVTNGTGWIQRSRCTIAGLYAYAKDSFVSDTIGYDKPAKEFTDYVTAHIPTFSKEEAVWIGDSLNADVRAAKEAGITSIWYNRRGERASEDCIPDYEGKSYADVLRILSNLG